MEHPLFILRKEVFGGTLYNKKQLRHTFLSNADLENLISENADFEEWTADLTNAPNSIVYSPIRIYYELTKKCNLHCRTCFNSSACRDTNEQTTEEVFHSLEGLRKDNVIDIRFTGGEITQREGWEELIAYAVKLGQVVSVNTNGVYDNDSIIDRLVKLNLAQITISVDGTQKYNDYIRGKGAFNRAEETLRTLKENGVPLRTIPIKMVGGSIDALSKIILLKAVPNYWTALFFKFEECTTSSLKIFPAL